MKRSLPVKPDSWSINRKSTLLYKTIQADIVVQTVMAQSSILTTIEAEKLAAVPDGDVLYYLSHNTIITEDVAHIILTTIATNFGDTRHISPTRDDYREYRVLSNILEGIVVNPNISLNFLEKENIIPFTLRECQSTALGVYIALCKRGKDADYLLGLTEKYDACLKGKDRAVCLCGDLTFNCITQIKTITDHVPYLIENESFCQDSRNFLYLIDCLNNSVDEDCHVFNFHSLIEAHQSEDYTHFILPPVALNVINSKLETLKHLIKT